MEMSAAEALRDAIIAPKFPRRSARTVLEPEIFEKISSIPCSAAELDGWHRADGAFQRLNPPWETVEMESSPPIENGNQASIRVKMGPFWKRWVAQYENVIPGEEFTDVQASGPFSEWRHRHKFLAKSGAEERCSLLDEIQFRAPLGPLGKWFAAPFIRRKLERMFTYRHDVTLADVERGKAHPAPAPMRILISGASGLVGRTLIPYLTMRGHTVLSLTRHPKDTNDIGWDPDSGRLDLSAAGKLDAVIHLAGENVAGGRWNKERMDRIFYSRKNGTRLLADTLAEMVDRPKVLLSASGVNYYESGAINRQDEDSPIGTQFLSEVCREWEQGTRPAKDAGIRVANLRTGMVLTPAGGALKKMLPAFKMGGGGRIGKGHQRTPWIAIDDLVDMFDRALGDERWSGPINAVAAEPATNREFTKALAKAVRRPAFIPAPVFALRAVLGSKMVDETLLADLPVYSKRLKEELDYELRHPELEGALRHLLGAHPREPRAKKIEVASPVVAAPAATNKPALTPQKSEPAAETPQPTDTKDPTAEIPAANDPQIALTKKPTQPIIGDTVKSRGAGKTS